MCKLLPATLEFTMEIRKDVTSNFILRCYIPFHQRLSVYINLMLNCPCKEVTFVQLFLTIIFLMSKSIVNYTSSTVVHLHLVTKFLISQFPFERELTRKITFSYFIKYVQQLKLKGCHTILLLNKYRYITEQVSHVIFQYISGFLPFSPYTTYTRDHLYIHLITRQYTTQVYQTFLYTG